MRKKELKKNTLFFSKRYGCYGQCIAIKDFMAYIIFVKQQSGWYPAAELEKSHYNQDGVLWAESRI